MNYNDICVDFFRERNLIAERAVYRATNFIVGPNIIHSHWFSILDSNNIPVGGVKISPKGVCKEIYIPPNVFENYGFNAYSLYNKYIMLTDWNERVPNDEFPGVNKIVGLSLDTKDISKDLHLYFQYDSNYHYVDLERVVTQEEYEEYVAGNYPEWDRTKVRQGTVRLSCIPSEFEKYPPIVYFGGWDDLPATFKYLLGGDFKYKERIGAYRFSNEIATIEYSDPELMST